MRAIALSAVLAVAAMAGQANAQDAAAGEQVFTKCKACHIADKDQNKIGPSLHGLFGRTAGTHPDFKYSPAMTDAGKNGLVWDEAKLTVYLHDPKAMVFAYSITNDDCPLPVKGYSATVKITDKGNGTCNVNWSGTFEPKGDAVAASKVVEGIYKGGIAGARRAVGG